MQIETITLFLLVCAVGIALGWLAGVRREREAHSKTREELAALRARSEAEKSASSEQISSLLQVERNLKESFHSLAAKALNDNADHLLRMSQSALAEKNAESEKDLAAKESSIAMLLDPMRVSLEKLANHSHELELKRTGAYEGILAEIKNMQTSHADLRRETTQLVQALRAPKVRGNWGEMQLRRCVEYSGMLEYASFDVEKFVRGDDSSVRPDMIVRLPNQRCIVVDAKTPLDSFMNAGACEDETLRQKYLADHATAVRKHLDALAGKAYWNRFRESPDFVVCFLPSEVLFSAALEQDPALLEYSANSNVLLATPTTLIALLKAVAYGWLQAQTARDADLIREAATNLYKKFAGLHDSLLIVGASLLKAGSAYNDVINKAEGHGGLFSIARKLRSLKIGEKDLVESKAVEFLPKALQHDEWKPGLSLAANAGEDNESRDAI